MEHFCLLAVSWSLCGIVVALDLEMIDIKINSMEQMIAKQAQIIEKQNSKIEALEGTALDYKIRFHELELGFQNLQKSNELCVKGLYSLKKEGHALNLETDSETIRPSETIGQMEDIEQHEDKRLLQNIPQGRTQPPPTFYAVMSHHEMNPGDHFTFVFDKVQVNIGGGYDKFSGIFTVPERGIYGFIFSVRMGGKSSGANGELAESVEIVRNNIVESVVYIEETRVQETVTGHLIIQAEAGDHVYLRIHLGHPLGAAIISDGSGWTSFAGWLIH